MKIKIKHEKESTIELLTLKCCELYKALENGEIVIFAKVNKEFLFFNENNNLTYLCKNEEQWIKDHLSNIQNISARAKITIEID